MKKVLILVFIIVYINSGYAQWECRSKLGSHLKPIGNSNVSWAVELIGSGGYLTNSSIANSMGIAGIDYATGKYTLYFEGGAKYWNKNDLDSDLTFDNIRFGLREFFLQVRTQLGDLTFGLNSAKLDDEYLINERVLGIGYYRKSNNWLVNVSSGTVSLDFARNGTFCGTCYLYDIFSNSNNNAAGNKLGQTNLTGLTIAFLPSKKQNKNRLPGSDSDDEFSTFNSDEFTPMEEKEKKCLKLKKVGIALYSEYGEKIDNTLFVGGFYGVLSLWDDIYINPELLSQISEDNRGFIFQLSSEKSFSWNNATRTTVSGLFTKFIKLNNNALPLNRFSNILAGEVLRLDTPELPVYNFGLKHNLHKYKTHVKLQCAGSLKTSEMFEVDIQVGKNFREYVLINAFFGYVRSDLIVDNDYALLGKMELRLTF